MRLREAVVGDMLAPDLLPACPCGDLGEVGQLVCTGCGRWLRLDGALDEKRRRMVDVRRGRWEKAA